MLVVRLRRIGKKNKPTYRIVATESSAPLQGKFIADLGYYNPFTKKTEVDSEEVKSWLNKGAKPSNTVAKILQSLKLKHASIVVIKKNKKAKKKDKKAAEAVKVEAQVDKEGTVEAEISKEDNPEPIEDKPET